MPQLPPRLFTDAYFAALARRAGLRRVTFDRDFERFDRLALLRLAADEANRTWPAGCRRKAQRGNPSHFGVLKRTMREYSHT